MCCSEEVSPGRSFIPLKVGIEKLTKFMNKMRVCEKADNGLNSLPELSDNDGKSYSFGNHNLFQISIACSRNLVVSTVRSIQRNQEVVEMTSMCAILILTSRLGMSIFRRRL